MTGIFRNIVAFFKKLIIALTCIMFSLTDVSHAFVMTDYVTYWVATDEPITVEWDPAQYADTYDVILVWKRGDTTMQVYNIAEDITTTEFVINTVPKTVTFVVGIRATNADGVDGEYSYSDNTQIASVDGQPRAWVLHYYMSSPGPIIIGKLKNF